MRPFLLISLLAAALFVPGPGSAGKADSAYRTEIDEWFAGRVERLQRPDGYLALVGLFPLSEGGNTFGSALDNALVFPEGAPAHCGNIRLDGSGLSIVADPNAGVTFEGHPVDRMALTTDADEKTTVLHIGTMSFYAIERTGQMFVRLKDTNAPALRDFTAIERFPVDARWRITATLEPYTPPRKIKVPNVLGGEFDAECPGALVFSVAGKKCRLEPMSESDDELFLVFGDETNARDTYGGGRFLYAAVPDSTGHVVLDFNKAYNPPCVFSPFATCPLPHQGNVAPFKITAGEKAYGAAHGR